MELRDSTVFDQEKDHRRWCSKEHANGCEPIGIGLVLLMRNSLQTPEKPHAIEAKIVITYPRARLFMVFLNVQCQPHQSSVFLIHLYQLARCGHGGQYLKVLGPRIAFSVS